MYVDLNVELIVKEILKQVHVYVKMDLRWYKRRNNV